MFSPFRARRPEVLGSGGKAPRERRRAASASPYARQENSQPPPVRPAGNPRWFSGIVSGAGRLLSSVFLSDSAGSSSPSSSYSSDAEGGGHDSSDEDENADACTTEFHELVETGRSIKSCMALDEGPQLITQRSERRLAIEKLLLQETFSRDEGDRLVKIIQSRIVDTTEGGEVAGLKELPDKTIHSDVTLIGTWKPLNRGSKFLEGRAYSANHLNDLSPGTSIFHSYSHDLCDKAIMEAKKWLEKKKVESTSNAELDSGPCILNTDALQYRMEDEAGSPVDIAKSYMRERPPWQSPLFSGIGFKTPPIGMHLFEDETPYATRADSFSTSKAMKRGNLATDCDDTRSVRPKSTENPPDSTVLHQAESSIRMSEHEAHQSADVRNMAVIGTNSDSNLLTAVEISKPIDASAGIPEKLAMEVSFPELLLNSPGERALQVNNLNSLPASEMTKQVDSSASLAAKLAVADGCPETISSPCNEKTSEVNHSTNDEVNAETDKINETSNLVSTNFTLDPENNLNGVSSNHETSTQPILPPDKETGQESLSSVFDFPDVGQPGAEKDISFGRESSNIFSETSQDMEASLPMEKQAKGVSVPNVLVFQETSANHNGARESFELLNIEPEEPASESVKSPCRRNIDFNASQPSYDSKIHAAGVHTDPSWTAFEVKNTPADSGLVDGKGQAEEEAISATGFAANGDLSLQAGSSSNPYIISLKESHHLPTSTNGGSPPTIPAEACQLSTDAPADAPIGHEISSILKKPQNGTTMKSVEQMLAENSPNSRHGRGRKAVAKSRRGRGRGRGRGK